MVMIHKITSSYFKGFKKQKTYGAILIYKDKYALVQGRYTGKWSFPKGHSNEGEKPIECTKREVEEENLSRVHLLPNYLPPPASRTGPCQPSWSG